MDGSGESERDREDKKEGESKASAAHKVPCPRVSGPGSRVQALGFWVWSLGSRRAASTRVEGFYGFGERSQGVMFGIEGFGQFRRLQGDKG